MRTRRRELPDGTPKNRLTSRVSIIPLVNRRQNYDEIVGTILFKHKDLQGDALASDFAAGQVQKNDQSKSRSIDAAWRQTVETPLLFE